MIVLLFLLSDLVSYSQETSALPNPLKFEQLSMKDGLSMNPVMAISQDKKGFLWFATQDGLNRYDGYSFLIHKNRIGDSTTLSDNLLTTLFNDKNGNLWVGTLNGGIQCLDMSQEKFTRYSLQKQSSNDLTPKTVWTVVEDSKGFIWLGTIVGLLRLDRQTGTILNAKELHKEFAPLTGRSVISILESESGTFWIGTESGLFRINIRTGELKLYKHDQEVSHSLSDNLVLSLCRDKKGNLWIGTVDGLNLFHPDLENFSIYKFAGKEQNNFTESKRKNISVKRKYSIFDTYDSGTIRCITEGDDGMLWLGTDLGLVHFNSSTKEYRRHRHELAQPNSLSSDLVRSIFIDNSGNLWVGTISAGINKLNLKPRKFEHFENKLNNPYKFVENYIRTVLEDRRGNLWIGAVQGGLVVNESNTGKITNYLRKEITDGTTINNNNVWVIFEDNKDFIWLGTSLGLNQYNPFTKRFNYFINSPEDSESISNNSIRCIFQDSRDLLWIGTENGLNIFDSKSRNFKRIFNINNVANSLSDNLVWKILEDNDGFMWIGTNNGLNKYDVVKDTFYTFKNIPSDTNSLSNNGIRTLFKDKAGYIWIGTQIGLNRMDPQTGRNWSFFEKDGLPNNFIYCILEDDKGGIWVSTNKGLSQLDPVSHRFKNFDIDDGLQDFEFNTNSCCKSSSSEMYFGGPNGLNRFNPEKIKDNLFVPPIVITEIKILNKGLRTNIPVSDIKELQLNYKENILYFEFSALDFTSPLKNEYAFLMEGFNTEWTYSGNRRSVNYTNLDPGEYIFRVRATNSDGYWNGDGPALRIVITPPFWHTKLFYILCVLFAFTIVFMYIKIRERNLKIEKKILEDKVEDRTLELKATNEQLAQNSTQLQQSYQNITLLSEVGKQITATLSVEAIIEKVYENVNQLMDATAFGIGLINKDQNRLYYPGFIEKKEKLPLSFYELTDDTRLAICCIKKNKEIFINDYQKEFNIFIPNIPIPAPIDGEMPEALIYLPLLSKGKPMGVITVQSFQKNAYTDYHLNILRNLANYVAIALENAHLYQNVEVEVKERTEEVVKQKASLEISNKYIQHLSDIGLQITSCLSVEKIIETVYENVNSMMDASSFWIGIYNETEKRLNYPMGIERGKTLPFAYYDISEEERLPVWSFKNQKEVFVNDYLKEYYHYIPNGTPPLPVVGEMPESSIWYPLVAQDRKTLGILTIQSFQKNSYTDYHLNIVRSLSLFISIALENALLYEKVEQKVKDRTAELNAEKETVEKINTELEKLSIVARETYNAVMIIAANGEIEWVNDGFTRLFGYTLEEYKLSKGRTLYDVSGNPNIRQLVSKCLEEKNSLIYESINVAKDGKQYYIQSTLTPISDENGKLKKIVVIDTDITEMKKAEEIIKEKNKDILDSITYAKNIQEAILPPKINLYNSFPGAFILFKPKDIVSGDFYWFNKVNHNLAFGFGNSEYKIMAAVDCTGHGVPGAFMSMIGNDLLNQFIIEKNNINPGTVLSLLNEGIHTALKQKEKAKYLRDGMDIGLCCISQDNRNLQFAGAFRPLWIVRKNELIEIKGDRYSIGGFTEPGTSFTNHEVSLEPGDSIYIFTDGFADQLGEKFNKKLLTKNFKILLLEIREVPMREQENIILKYFEDWKGREVQTDDCLVIGVRI